MSIKPTEFSNCRYPDTRFYTQTLHSEKRGLEESPLYKRVENVGQKTFSTPESKLFRDQYPLYGDRVSQINSRLPALPILKKDNETRTVNHVSFQSNGSIQTSSKLKELREDVKKIIDNIRPHLVLMNQVDLNTVRHQRSFSEIAQKRKAAVTNLLTNLNRLNNLNLNFSELKGNESYDLSNLSDPCIINTFPESVWIPLRHLRVALEESDFKSKIDTLSVSLQKLNLESMKLPEPERNRISGLPDLPVENPNPLKIHMQGRNSRFPQKYPKRDVKNQSHSGSLIAIRTWFRSTFQNFIGMMKYIWRTFWY
jgi:hypothetical protein